jgi:hypothetical protein
LLLVTHPPQVPYSHPVAPPPPPLGPIRIEPVAGTEYGLAYLRVAPVRSGPAIGSMIVGIASLLVVLTEVCLGLVGSADGWGALVAGAFGILALLLGAGAIGVGLSARRTIRASGGAITGAAMATAGIICGIVGAAVAVIGFGASLAATLAS